YQFLNASLDYERKKAQQEAQDILTRAKQQARRQKIVGIIFSLVALIAGGWATWQILNLRSQRYADLQRRISLGEDILLNPNLDKRAGAKQFAQGNFTVAAQSFQRSRQELPQDPETLIYQNNARLINLNPVTIAVSVPIGKNKAVAQQMLRGVAQAQQEVNQDCKPAQLIVSCGIRGRPLQIKIVNDDNDPEIARELAAVLIKDSSILAVVGHNASDVSRPAAKIYQHRLVMISPTSFSVDFREITSSQDNYRDNYIFRTIPGIKHNVQSLVKHIAQSVNQPKILICYDSEADDNHSFKKEFSKFAHKIDMVDLDCDLSNPNLDYQQIINQGIQHQANSLLLAPHVDRINEAIKIAKINYQRGEQKLRLFSSPSLYTSQTLEDELGREAVIGMQMAVAWHPEAKIDRNFREQAQKLWKTNLNYKIVTWRTAMSYDATQAIVQGLSKQSHFTRSILQKALSEPEFSFSGATGLVQFEHGERIEKNALLVEIQSSNNSETDADFVLLAN
ncbi:MAG: ABC transporter substrate-binding protein, partial [Cyanobacteria bacterium P01_A01_bin.40]